MKLCLEKTGGDEYDKQWNLKISVMLQEIVDMKSKSF